MRQCRYSGKKSFGFFLKMLIMLCVSYMGIASLMLLSKLPKVKKLPIRPSIPIVRETDQGESVIICTDSGDA